MWSLLPGAGLAFPGITGNLHGPVSTFKSRGRVVKIVCQKCGANAPTGAKFCTSCGNKLGVLIVENAPVPPRLRKALGSDYDVVGELGRGGFAVVYSVRDRKARRYLAVKVMHPDLMASSEVVERFKREAEIAGRLDHPGILPVVFTGEGEGLVFYAMPRVRGNSLKEKLKGGPLDITVGRQVFRQVSEGLAHAHNREVVHRDIKPANIMIREDGKALILDFGIAKGLSTGAGALTMTGQLIGSAEYMSPEQAAGDKTLDRRSDIYSLGITAFEMLTGRIPFVGDSTMEIVAQRFIKDAPDVRTVRPEVPSDFAESIGKCLATNPGDRWQYAEQAVAALV